MNTQGLVTRLNNWSEKLMQKEFIHFTTHEQTAMKNDYRLAVKLFEGYGTNSENVVTLKKFSDLVGDMEGFFFETVQ